MQNYLELVQDVLLNGEVRGDRTGTGTISVFGRTLKYDLQKGFPLVTTKRVFYKGVLHELLWMISGETHIQRLRDAAVKIWDPWADEDGNVGRMYGVQWRNWKKRRFAGGEYVGTDYIDQLQNAIDTIKHNPTSRRIMVNAWNPGELDEMNLPPCHYSYQFYVRQGRYLDILVNQRSADVFLGLPFDIASYATLTHMIAYLTGLEAGTMTYNLGDTHIYSNHVKAVETQLSRTPKELPTINVNRHKRTITSIDDFKYDDIEIIGYNPYKTIKAEISV